MTGFVVVGTDTDAGKTSFALLFLAASGGRFTYWKPVETGDSDTARVRRFLSARLPSPPGSGGEGLLLTSGCKIPSSPPLSEGGSSEQVDAVHNPLASFRDPVAPCLAAAREGRTMPGVADIIAAAPRSDRPLLIETFGGPMSPLTGDVLQIDLIRAWKLPVVLVTSSVVGAVGRTLSTLAAMESHGVRASAVVLLGPRDGFAEEQIANHKGVPVFGLVVPGGKWTDEALHISADEQSAEMARIARIVDAEKLVSEAPEAPASLLARDRTAVWHPYTSLADPAEPLAVVGAEREFLHTADGRVIIDAVSSWWTILHGHRQPILTAALAAAAHTLDHVLFAGVTHPDAVQLAERLLATTPWPDGRVFFSDNGSTAVEVALKMAYQFWRHRGEPDRTLFVGFTDGYHGDTFGAMAVGRDPLFFGAFEPLLFRALQAPLSAERLDAMLNEHSGRIAAVIVEPLVQGAGGMRMHGPDELRALYEVSRRHKVLFIADEVMTGCRTGCRWAFQHAGIAPDLICAAKTLTGGILPLAATLASPDIVAAFQTADRTRTFFHGHSFTANPLACAVAVANDRLLADGGWLRDSRRIEAFWRRHLVPLRDRPGVADVRICGTIAAVELAGADGYLAEVGPRIRSHAIARGVLLRPLGRVVYSLPPLCTSEESLSRIVEAISESVA